MEDSILGTSYGLLIVLIMALFAHEPFRWAGIYIGRGISADSQFFVWVRAVATALVAGLVTRLVLFPAGALEGVPVVIRCLALAVGIGVYFACGKHLGAGVFSAAIFLTALQYIIL